MQQQIRCGNVMCLCTVSDGQRYCSQYCAQAAEQGIERNYCQCEHERAAPLFRHAPVFPAWDEVSESPAKELLAVG